MIQPKFKVGDAIICVRINWSEKKVVCPDCLGTKEWDVSLPSGETFKHDCQTCMRGYFNSGQVSEWGDFVTQKRLTIGSIQINTAEEENPIRYMCKETGVGSGSVYDEKELFDNELEADVYGNSELERVKGLRQQEEIKQRKYKKSDRLIHGKRQKKSK